MPVEVPIFRAAGRRYIICHSASLLRIWRSPLAGIVKLSPPQPAAETTSSTFERAVAASVSSAE